MGIFRDDLGLTFVGFSVTIVGVGVVLFGGSGLLARQLEIRQCNLIREQGTNAKYTGFWTGCYIEVNGRFIPEKNWRGEYQQDISEAHND